MVASHRPQSVKLDLIGIDNQTRERPELETPTTVIAIAQQQCLSGRSSVANAELQYRVRIVHERVGRWAGSWRVIQESG
jgi:hypothetical protein